MREELFPPRHQPLKGDVSVLGSLLGEVLREQGLEPEQLAATVATGYGRDRVDGRLASVTEISCHARGIHALLPETIGGHPVDTPAADGTTIWSIEPATVKGPA